MYHNGELPNHEKGQISSSSCSKSVGFALSMRAHLSNLRQAQLRMPLILLLLCLLATTTTGAITNVPSNELDENQAIAASNEDLPSLFDLNFMSDASEITAVSSNTTKSLSHGQERLRSLNYQFGNSSIRTSLIFHIYSTPLRPTLKLCY